jgi:predicted PurR-regulated permease PerM
MIKDKRSVEFIEKQNALTLAIFIAAIFLIWKFSFVFIVLFASFLLTFILLPFTKFLKKFRIPALFAVLIPIFALLGMTISFGTLVAPVIKEQLVALLENLPSTLSSLPFADALQLNDLNIREFIIEQRGGLSRTVLDIGQSIAHFLFGLITVIVITTYWLSDYERIKSTLSSFVAERFRYRFEDIWRRLETKLGKWFLGQIMVSLAVGVMVWLAASVIGLPYAVALGVLAGLLEILPTLGPILAAVPAVLIGGTDSFEKAALVVVVYTVIQQIESHLITPQLMGRTVKLHPIAIITSFLAGSVALGIIGALLSVPFAIVVSSVVDSLRKEQIVNNSNK